MHQLYQLIWRVVSFWAFVNVCHVILTKLFTGRYSFLLSRNGVFIKFVTIQWHTKRFNYTLVQDFNSRRFLFLKGWFVCGAYFGVLAMVMSILILLYTFICTFVTHSSNAEIMTPVIPGVNLPANQVFPYLLTLLLSGIFHEFGHALAASLDGVTMYGSGIFLFLIYPAAFVELNTEMLKECSPFHRLRIFCAGVWHNVIMMAGAFALWCTLPGLLFCLGYIRLPTSVTVTSVQAGSVMENKLSCGTQIYSLNDCLIHGQSSWSECLQDILMQQPIGYCIQDHVISELQLPDDCCQGDIVSARGVCFESRDRKKCLIAREVLELPICSHDCDACYRPSKEEGFLISLKTDTGNKLFVGDPFHLYLTVDVSNYKSKLFWSGFPNAIELFLMYVISLSGALAIFNAVPAFYLDGQHILDTLLEVMLGSTDHNLNYRNKLSHMIQVFSSVLIAINVCKAFLMLFTVN